ncbi:MAG: hypothetical protein QHJ73_19350, partial [Armatimonadota bacterium]|nr:hypothetical protein [Armatimonadota bacterium]
MFHGGFGKAARAGGMGAMVTTAVFLFSTGALGAVQGSPKPAQPLEPGDRMVQHVQTITTPHATYTVPFGGTVDGVMTRSPIGYAAFTQGFQPNVRVRLENVGDTDVVNPWLVVNGKRNWRTVADIVAEATRGCGSEREKAIAIWRFQQNHRFHATTWDAEVQDPVKMLNVYGYTLCGDDALVLAALMQAAGLKTRPGRPIGHSTTEVLFDGA